MLSLKWLAIWHSSALTASYSTASEQRQWPYPEFALFLFLILAVRTILSTYIFCHFQFQTYLKSPNGTVTHVVVLINTFFSFSFNVKETDSTFLSLLGLSFHCLSLTFFCWKPLPFFLKTQTPNFLSHFSYLSHPFPLHLHPVEQVMRLKHEWCHVFQLESTVFCNRDWY